MPRAAVYRARSQQGVCPQCGRIRESAWFTCAPCRAMLRTAQRTRTEQTRLAPGPNLLGCCGQFHPITQTPLAVPCCGRVWLQPTEETPV